MKYPTGLPDDALTREVLALVSKAHAGQVRADGVTPYLEHPVETAHLALGFWPQGLHPDSGGMAPEGLVRIALAHDVLEDCGPEWADLLADVLPREEFLCVDYLTKRGPDYFGLLMRSPIPAAAVKLCDRLSNIRDMTGWGPGRRARYLVRTAMDVLPLSMRSPLLYGAGDAMRDELRRLSNRLARDF
jgi:(p)ppGpp synthase/HD superfamily hydrolase